VLAGHALLAGGNATADVLLRLPQEGSNVDGLVAEVPDGLHPGRILLPQVLEILVSRLARLQQVTWKPVIQHNKIKAVAPCSPDKSS
jgi:hypothetical protein